MITLIHGEDISGSRKFFSELKENQKSLKSFEGDKISLTELTQVLEGNDLFDDSPAIFIEHFFSKKKTGDEKKSILDFITSKHNATVVFWEQKEITKKDFGKYPMIKSQQFDLPKILFKFLDSILPNNGREAIELFHETISFQPPELVFFMMIRKFRLLLGILDRSLEAIDEIHFMQGWQSNKLQNQATKFGEEKLLQIYAKLFAIEKSIKTGTNPTPLTSLIDFLLLEI